MSNSVQIPRLIRTATAITREYLSEAIEYKFLEKDKVDRIIEKIKFAQRVHPLVDLETHGKPTVAKNLRQVGILKPEMENEIKKIIIDILKNIKNKEEFGKFKMLFINATESGGGVAEMRPNNCLFMQEFNIESDWAVIDGCDEFYSATVHIHEGIQNPNYSPLQNIEYDILSLISVNNFSRFTSLKIFDKYDILWIDDPQPLGMIPMIRAKYPNLPIIWRCHVHSDPEPSIKKYLSDVLEGKFNKEHHFITWQYMKSVHNIDLSEMTPNQLRVNAAVFHLKEFSEGLSLSKDIPVVIMGPAIDPLAFKNMPLSQKFINATLERYKIKTLPNESNDALKIPPIVLEVSRYDPYKGPFEIVVSFIEAIRNIDTSTPEGKSLQEESVFIFAASTPGDNPTGAEIYENLLTFVKNCPVVKNVKGLFERIFLLSLKDKRRAEILRKTIFDKVWEEKGHKDELIMQNALMNNVVGSLETIINSLQRKSIPLINEETAEYLRQQGDEIIEKNSSAFFTKEQTEAISELMQLQSFQGASVCIKVENNHLSGKEINHLEVNAMQTAALVKCQFSSKEGFGLVVSEAMIKKDECTPKINGVTISTTAGGIKSQINSTVGIPIDYPKSEVEESLEMYRALNKTHVESPEKAQKLYDKIVARKSVKNFSQAIEKALRMAPSEREIFNEAARNHIMQNFTIHSNVKNILKAVLGVVKDFKYS